MYGKLNCFLFQVLQSDGGNYSVCVNAATLAVIDAGIAMEEFVISCTSSLANGETPLLDISHLEETMGGPSLTVAILPISGKVHNSFYFLTILIVICLFFFLNFYFR